MFLGIQNITYYFFFFFFYQHAIFLRLRHCPLSGKWNVIFLISPVYKLLCGNLLHKVVVAVIVVVIVFVVVIVRFYSSSWWSRDYFRGSWFSPGMCIKSKLISHLDLSLPFRCVFILMPRLARGAVAWQPLSDTSFQGSAAVWVRSPGAALRAAKQTALLVAFPRDSRTRTHTGFCHVALPPQVTFALPELISCLFLLFLCRCWDGWRRSWFAVKLREAWSIVHPLLTFEVL